MQWIFKVTNLYYEKKLTIKKTCNLLHIFCIQSTDVILATATGVQLQLGLQRPDEISDLPGSLWGHSYVMQFLQCSDGKPLRGKQDRTKGGSIYSMCFSEFQFMLATYITN